MEWHALIGAPIELYTQAWMSLQLDLTSLSSNSTHVIAKESGHFVMIDQPEAVVNAIRQVVEAARDK